ncbi:MAG: hypothetical protein ACRDPK_07310 [Carbonactinosporaceae bacterium]
MRAYHFQVGAIEAEGVHFQVGTERSRLRAAVIVGSSPGHGGANGSVCALAGRPDRRDRTPYVQ